MNRSCFLSLDSRDLWRGHIYAILFAAVWQGLRFGAIAPCNSKSKFEIESFKITFSLSP